MFERYELLERFHQGDDEIIENLISGDTRLFLTLLESAVVRKRDPDVEQVVLKDDLVGYYYTRDFDCFLSSGLKNLYEAIVRQDNSWRIADRLLSTWGAVSDRFESDAAYSSKQFSDALQKAWDEEHTSEWNYMDGEWSDPVDIDGVADAVFSDNEALGEALNDSMFRIRNLIPRCCLYILKLFQLDNVVDFKGQKMEVFISTTESIQHGIDQFDQWMDEDDFDADEKFAEQDIAELLESYCVILEHGQRILSFKSQGRSSPDCGLD